MSPPAAQELSFLRQRRDVTVTSAPLYEPSASGFPDPGEGLQRSTYHWLLEGLVLGSQGHLDGTHMHSIIQKVKSKAEMMVNVKSLLVGRNAKVSFNQRQLQCADKSYI